MLQLLSCLFVLSGAAGLIYETVWTRYLSLFVGHSAYAQILVLVIFLGGMAIGSFIVGSRSDRLRAPLVWYAAVELVVAGLGIAFHPMFIAITNGAYDHLFPAIGAASGLTIVKWSIAGLMILPQSILLGATFPLMTAGAIRVTGGQRRSGHTVAVLYFANSIGAAIGGLVEGFVLIGTFGLPGTLATAAALNTIVALAVFTIVRYPVPWLAQAGPDDASDTAPMQTMTGPGTPPTATLWRVLLAVSFGTALTSFIYEIGWVRMLALVLGGATHSFELMLSAFILGLALGALWIRRRIDRDTRPLRTLGIVQWAMGLAAVATLPVYSASFGWMATLIDAFKQTDSGYAGFSLSKYALTLAVMLPATFCAGMTLPIITRTLYAAGAGERSVGAVYGVNTLGSIVGAGLAGLVLLPLLGLEWLLVSGAAIDIAMGIALVMWHRRLNAAVEPQGTRRARAILPTRGLIGPVVATGSIVAALAIVSSFDRDRLSSGVYRYGAVPAKGNSVFLFYRDGRTAAVSVRRAADDTNSLMTLATNGKPDASVYPTWRRPFNPDDPPIQLNDDMGTQVLLPLVTLAHAPRARTVAVIGEGSGMTSHFLLGSPNIQHLYTIEIEPEMIHGSHVFYPANRRVFDDPRSTFILDDARGFLSASGMRFDMILSEPSNPWVSGVSGLFTQEFYRRVRAQLAPNGIFAQWMHLYEIDDALVATVLAAVDKVFPSYTVFLTSNSDILIIASPATTLPSPDWSVVTFPGVAEDLRRVVPIAPEQFEAMRLASRELLHPYLSTRVVPNSDFSPALDLGTERSRFEKDFAMGFLTLGETRLDLDAAIAGVHHDFGTAFQNPTTEIARVRDMALAVRLRAIRATPMPGAVAQSDSELRAVVYRDDGFERLIATTTPPMDWRLWTDELVTVESDLHFGTAGIADEAFYGRVRQYLDHARPVPPEAQATVNFLHGLATWNYAESATASTVLLAAEARGETWIPLDLLRDGSALSKLMINQPMAARVVFMNLAHDSGDTATVSDLLLQSLIATRAAAAPAGSAASAPRRGLRAPASPGRF